ncbi:MAG: hypothetical protein WBR15_03220 [Gammaproteobacteria bacterium]
MNEAETRMNEEFMNAFTEVTGTVINIIGKVPGGYIGELSDRRVLIYEEEVKDFPTSSGSQQREMVENIKGRPSV